MECTSFSNLRIIEFRVKRKYNPAMIDDLEGLAAPEQKSANRLINSACYACRAC